MPPQNSPFDHLFTKLMELKDTGEEEALFAELLRQGDNIVIPLGNFLTEQLDRPEACILVELLGKCMSRDAIPILIELMSVELPELRRAAANGLGWNRAVQALERLDRAEADDPDPGVRLEARTAIEEILRDFPKERDTLRHHVPPDDLPDPTVPADHDLVPVDAPDAEQRIKLMAALPRLLALKYRAVPLHFSPNGVLHLAVARDGDRYLLTHLADVSGHSVELKKWSDDHVRSAIAHLYTLGDDDFCTFHDRLTEPARAEMIERVLEVIDPNEPAAPLDEANDAVEAVQSFLGTCCRLEVAAARITLTPPNMTIYLEGPDSTPTELAPPLTKLRERFLDALRILAGLHAAPGISHQEGGSIPLVFCEPHWKIHVRDETHLGGTSMELRLERVG